MPNGDEAASARFSCSFSSEPTVIVDVVVPRHLHRVFSYRVPSHLVGHLAIGSWVRVPFGRSIVNGLVIAWSPTDREPSSVAPVTPYRLRDIAGLADPDGMATMPPELFTLIRLVAEYYVAPLGQCLHLALPPMQSRKVNERYVATPQGQSLEALSATSLSATALAMLVHVKKRPAGLTAATLRRVAGPSFRRDLASLIRHRLIHATSGAPRARRLRARDASPLATWEGPGPASAPREPSMSHRLAPVQHALHTGRPARFLLRGPQEARLPWVLALIDVAIAEHRTVLVLIGEIRKAQRLATLVQSQSGQPVALWHSDLPVHVRRERWQGIRRGAYRIVVGTRSAVFSPLAGLGIVVVEDEHDDAYKEESEPRYHARTVAWMRAKLEKAALILGSAHPSLETFETVKAADEETRSVELLGGSSAHSGPLASPTTALVEVVDVRRQPFGTLFSEPMIAGIRRALDRRTFCVLFLNRTGFAPALICRDCGQTPQCPHCSVSMTFYKRAARLGCRYCGLLAPLPDVCPTCSAARLEPVGIGTEAVEEQTRRLFPTATTVRMDRETVSASFRVALEAAVAKREVHILVGTQMLIQGPPLPAAGFVGVVDADAGLHRPDFRASEQSYHALVDVTGLASPASQGGHVVLQTRLPTHHAIRAIAEDSSQTFYEAERQFRRLLGYPPYADLILLHASATSDARARGVAQQVATFLRSAEASGEFSVWGPIAAPLAHVRGRHRWQIAVKATHGLAARAAVHRAVQALERESRHRGVKLDVDVDPISMA